MDEEIFDVIVVGGGIAGATCAYLLAQEGHSVVLIDRGSEPGSKNLSGGVFYCRVMEQIFPGFTEAAPIERHIVRNTLGFLNQNSHVAINYGDSRLGNPVNAVSVLRAPLDSWLAEQCEEAGVMVMPSIRVDSLIMEKDQCVGVRAGAEELRARIVVAADGVNSFLAQGARIRAKEPAQNLALGVKSVIRLGEASINERFHVSAKEGAAYAIVGDATQGIPGGGFLYTNKDSVSIGVVLRLDALAENGLSSSDIHDHFLNHPAIRPLIAGGELLEYGCHLTIENGPHMMNHDLTRPGLMIIGDAAGFTLNTGFAIRGMDLAAGSAQAAAQAAHAALLSGDYSRNAMDTYPAALAASFVGKDCATYEKAPAFFENPRLYSQYGQLLAEVFFGIYAMDGAPHRRISTIVRGALRLSGTKATHIVRDAIAALRSL